MRNIKSISSECVAKIKWKLKWIIAPLYRVIVHTRRVRKVEQGYSKNSSVNVTTPPTVVFMIDGKMTHGGMSDRLCGLISAYNISKELGYQFKINWVTPFHLSEYLLPNKVDWQINDDFKINYDLVNSKVRLIPFYPNNSDLKRCVESAKEGGYNQLHIYSVARYFPVKFSQSFNELFKLPQDLNYNIDYHLEQIGCDYMSITFRFQQLLGDFKEGNYKVLALEDRKSLINRCLKTIEIIHERKKEYKKILVTADSGKFLAEAAKIPYVYTIPGDILHMDYHNNIEDRSINLKSFIDLFMISCAKEVVAAYVPGLMYQTSFPFTAARISGAKGKWCNIDELLNRSSFYELEAATISGI